MTAAEQLEQLRIAYRTVRAASDGGSPIEAMRLDGQRQRIALELADLVAADDFALFELASV
ncbi:hypothetical protein [Actinoplanes rectilineatus]|uniref:hypothetical protein n=1 Tax=Actinoplanes rectilineatus TaxID=113571 RepID=UPI0005F29ED7|nr:hypothetical protein [Actinoplanes rectilineatus]